MTMRASGAFADWSLAFSAGADARALAGLLLTRP